MLSFWEINSFLNYEHIIIGSGILGLSVACSIRGKNPDAKVLVLERGIFPEGASTKNAGFACFGSLSEILSDFERIGIDETVSLVEKRWKGINLLRKRLGDEKTGFLNYGGYELLDEKHLNVIDKMNFVNEKLSGIFKSDVFNIRNEMISEFGFNENKVKALIHSQYESQIDTGKMMSSLIEYTASLGIKIINGCNVIRLSEKDNFVRVICGNNKSDEQIYFSGKKVILCSNAFTKKLLPEIRIKPGRGQVIVTKPIKDLKIKGVFHYDEGYYYFRNFENRIMFGGGRNLDFEKEESDEFELNEKILSDLKEKLDNMILPGQKYEIDHSWSGIMGFTENKLPLVKNISDRIVCVVSCNGMGIALSSYIAESL
ncbi:MAG TPA: FAD-dependent oxidoreductase [Ignavibacteria bacterium]|nr:FAD-dependent oxidoreductase [Ignavibacteria bacterium]